MRKARANEEDDLRIVLTRKKGFIKRRNDYREWKGNLGIFMVLTGKKNQFFRIPRTH